MEGTKLSPRAEKALVEARRRMRDAEADLTRATRSLERRLGDTVEPALSVAAAEDDQQGGPWFAGLSYENAKARHRAWTRALELIMEAGRCDD